MMRSEMNVSKHPSWMNSIHDDTRASNRTRYQADGSQIEMSQKSGTRRTQDGRYLKTPKSDRINSSIVFIADGPLFELTKLLL